MPPDRDRSLDPWLALGFKICIITRGISQPPPNINSYIIPRKFGYDDNLPILVIYLLSYVVGVDALLNVYYNICG